MVNNLFRNYKYAIVRKPPLSMAQGITTQAESIDIALARQQHQQYVNALNKLGIATILLEPEESLPDSHFVEDTAIIYHNKVMMTRPGAKKRRAESETIRKALPPELELIEIDWNADETATLDGGDVIIMGERVLIGISDRTNLAGANLFMQALREIDHKLQVHCIQFSGVLHLKSGLTALNENTMLANPAMRLYQPLPIKEVLWLPEEEGYAANSLVVNGAAFYFAECKHAGDAIRHTNLTAVPLELSEFRKMDGSFTCLSLLWN